MTIGAPNSRPGKTKPYILVHIKYISSSWFSVCNLFLTPKLGKIGLPDPTSPLQVLVLVLHFVLLYKEFVCLIFSLYYKYKKMADLLGIDAVFILQI